VNNLFDLKNSTPNRKKRTNSSINNNSNTDIKESKIKKEKKLSFFISEVNIKQSSKLDKFNINKKDSDIRISATNLPKVVLQDQKISKHKRNKTALTGQIQDTLENYIASNNNKKKEKKLSIDKLKNETFKMEKTQRTEDSVTQCFSNSLKILEKIQKEFENSARNNVIKKLTQIDERPINKADDRDTGSKNIINFVKTEKEETNQINLIDNFVDNKLYPQNKVNLTTIKENSIEYNDYLRNLGLTINKIDKYKYYQVVNISTSEKEFITRKIEEKSDDRIKNYSTLFQMINGTLEDIKLDIRKLNMYTSMVDDSSYKDLKKNSVFSVVSGTNNESPLKIKKVEETKEDRENNSENLNDNLKYNLQYLEIYKNTKQSEYSSSSNEINKNNSKGSLNSLCNNKSFDSKESCNFSENSMLENAIISPPKIENQCGLLSYQKMLNFLKEEDVTIIEFDSLLQLDEKTSGLTKYLSLNIAN
jgi:hypothetical protein